jgi:hypothetical protein
MQEVSPQKKAAVIFSYELQNLKIVDRLLDKFLQQVLHRLPQ